MAEMSELDKSILRDVEFFKDRYFCYDEPIPLGGITLFPVSMRDYSKFMSAVPCLNFIKNDEIKGIRMTNSEYLLSKIKDEHEGPMWSMRLSTIMELCLHIKPGFRCKKCGNIISFEEYVLKFHACSSDEERSKLLNCSCGAEEPLVPSLTSKTDSTNKEIFVFNGIDITEDMFNKIRKYILYQNLPDYKDDSWVDKAVRDDQAERDKLLNKDSGTASTERKFVCVAAATSFTMEQLYNMSIRKFLLLLGAVNDLIEYKIIKQGLASGMVKLQEGQKIDHWLYKKNGGLYGAAVDAESLSTKIRGL